MRSKNIHYFIDFYWPSQALKSVSKNIQIRRFLFWEVWNSGFEGWPPRWWMRACIGWMSEGRAGSIGLNLPHLRNRSSDTGTGRPDWWSNTPPCVFITCFNIYIKFLPPRDSDLIEATFGHGEANYLHTKEDLRSEFRRGSGANWDAAPAQCAAYHRLAEIGAQQWNSGMLTEAPEARAGQSASTSYNYTAGICHGTEQRRWRCNAICFN